MNTITLDNSTYNDVEAYARLNNISVTEAIKNGIKILLSQFKARTVSARVRLEQRIDELEHLQANWDNENAPSISSKACQFSREVLRNTSDALLDGLAIFPNTNGKILMQWRTENGDACLSILDDAFAYDVNYGKSEKSGVLPKSQISVFLNELKNIV